MDRDNLKIAVIMDTLTVEQGTGETRYAKELVRGLSESCEIRVIGSSAVGTLKSVINHGVVTPLKVFRSRKQFHIFHALTPVYGLPLPLLSKPTVVTYHDLSTLLYGTDSSWHSRISAPHLYKLGKYCSMAIANSSQTKDELVQYLNFPQEKIRIINLGVADRFKPYERKNSNHSSIGYIGTPTARKRVDYLLKAFHYLKKNHERLNVKLKIYGRHNAEYQSLVKLADDLNIKQDVEFPGQIPEKDLIDVYNSLDIYVVPSEWEGFGLPILEAQRCGIPVVIRADAHIPEEVGRYCLKATSERHMADILYEILEDDALRGRVTKNGLVYSQLFTWEKTIGETLSVYKDVLGVG